MTRLSDGSDLQSRVQTALTESPLHSLRRLTVRHRNDDLLISGKVTCFYHKQMAQELVLALAGPIPVVNEVEVNDWQVPPED